MTTFEPRNASSLLIDGLSGGVSGSGSDSGCDRLHH
jgi:hypothetical protein